MEVRKGGIAFQIGKTFKYRGHEIPQADLYRLACEMNMTQLVKRGLSSEWLRRKASMATQQDKAE